jgi:methanogenic corrinoid protein MtbC1
MALSALDVETFARTALRCAAKRRELPAREVTALTGEMVRGLARLAPEGASGAGQAIDRTSVAAFCEALLEPEAEAALRFVEALQRAGVTSEELYLGHVAAAARELGAGWTGNRLSLVEVTVATGHLYAVMRALRSAAGRQRPAADAGRSALFAAVPGEDHSIGVSIAAEIFRDAGWDIDLQLGTDHDGLIARAERTRPRVVGLALSTPKRLAALARLVLGMRFALPEAIIGVAPGAGMDAAALDGLLDIDLVFRDVQTAREELERQLRPRG